MAFAYDALTAKSLERRAEEVAVFRSSKQRSQSRSRPAVRIHSQRPEVVVVARIVAHFLQKEQEAWITTLVTLTVLNVANQATCTTAKPLQAVRGRVVVSAGRPNTGAAQ